jgi:hypothetical protein
MKRLPGWTLVALLVLGLVIAACGRAPASTSTGEKPARLEKLGGGQPARVILTETGAKRIGLQTTAVRESAAAQQTSIPYSAVLYDNQGKSWAYTNPETLVFVRQPVTIVRVDGDQAILSVGPPLGASVVTIGAAELYGAETEFAK